MGAWGYGPFDNDGALDALGDIADGPAEELVQRLRTVLSGADAEDHLENPEASGAMAAAVIVAARLGADPGDADAERFLAENAFEVSPELREHALRAFTRVTTPGDNEWYELWEDAGSLAKVLELHEPFRVVLAG